MPRPPIQFSWNISIGNILSALSGAGAAIIAVSLAYSAIINSIDKVVTRVDLLEKRVTVLEDRTTPIPEVARRLSAAEMLATNNDRRLDAIDIGQTRIDAKLSRLDELMQEVRNELRTFNTRN